VTSLVGSESESNHIPLGGMVVVGHMGGECSNTWPCSFLPLVHADADEDTALALHMNGQADHWPVIAITGCPPHCFTFLMISDALALILNGREVTVPTISVASTCWALACH
jgi:hypothetical protein